jgi:hypothetical protein
VDAALSVAGSVLSVDAVAFASPTDAAVSSAVVGSVSPAGGESMPAAADASATVLLCGIAILL